MQKYVFIFLLSLLASSPALYAQYSFIMNDMMIHHERLTLFYAYTIEDPSLFPNDVFVEYYFSQHIPVFYKGLLYLFSRAGYADAFFILYALVSYALCSIFVLLISFKIQGKETALGALILFSYLPIYYFQSTSGLAHAMGIPLLMACVYGLLTMRVWFLSVTCLCAAGFYPLITPIIGLCMAWSMLIPPKLPVDKDINQHSITIRLAILSIIGGLSFGLLYLSISPTPEHFGNNIGMLGLSDTFPENGPDGHHFMGTTQPLKYIFVRHLMNFKIGITSLDVEALSLQPHVILSIIVFTFLSFVPLLRIFQSHSILSRIRPFVITSVALAVFFYFFAPTLSYRFPYYAYYALCPIIVSYGLFTLLKQNKETTKYAALLTLIICLIFGQTMDYNNPIVSSYYNTYGSEEKEFFAFAAETPKDTLFVGFPNLSQIQEAIPLKAKRSVLLHYKSYMPKYDALNYTMRERMYAIIDAYYTQDWDAVKALRDKFGADYLIVNLDHLNGNEKKHEYFDPFEEYIIKKRQEAIQNGGFLLSTPPENDALIAFKANHFYVIDLSKL